MISYTCKTAVKAVIYLASKFESGEKAGILEIATYLKANEHTVGKLLQTLVKENVINSHKGPLGGFFLSPIQAEQHIINIVQAIDGNKLFEECGLGLSKCLGTHPCPIHDDYKVARDALETLFRTKTITDLYKPVNNGLTYLFG